MSNIIMKLKLSLILLLSAQTALMAVPSNVSGEEVSSPIAAQELSLSRWGIYKDGTHPVETTKGINDALAWASKNGITAVTLPGGTYLIDKDSRINMVSNMLFELPADAVLQKEKNGKERYDLMYMGYGVHNVTLKGGTYKGDKDTHDYSKKDNQYSSGTHEGGYGINTEGASNITIDGVKATHFTGDGLILAGYGQMISDLYETGFVSGGLDTLGRPVKNTAKVRTKTAFTFKHPIFKTENKFEISNIMKLPASFEVYFYKADGTFIKKITSTMRAGIEIPAGADHFHLVFDQAAYKGAYLEFWNRVVTRDVIVKNSEFAFNRRQGITVGGADNVLITNNRIHDMKGTAPQSGIDLEGGFHVNGYLNTNVKIRGNDFYNNAAYDVILFDGEKASVENNHFGSKGAIGLAVSKTFKWGTIVNNHFDGSRISAENASVFLGNKMNDSYTTFQGPNIRIDGMELTDSRLGVSAQEAFGISVSNVTMYNNKKSDSGLAIWGKPIRITNMTIIGEPTLRAVTGGGTGGSIFENLKVIGFNSSYGLSLPPGTYNNSVFEWAEGSRFGSVGLSLGGKYVFNGCIFRPNTTTAASLLAEHKDMDLTVKNSTFELKGNTQAISVQSAKNVLLYNNIINANNLTLTTVELIKINDYWKRNEPVDVLNAVIRRNTITGNIPAIGISTVYAGVDAPPYIVDSNTLYKVKLAQKANDTGDNILQ